jgi:hypothetical protein
MKRGILKNNNNDRMNNKKVIVTVTTLVKSISKLISQNNIEWLVVLPDPFDNVYELPSNLGDLTKMKRLDVCCSITRLPDSLVKCTRLKRLTLLGQRAEVDMSDQVAYALNVIQCDVYTTIGGSSDVTVGRCLRRLQLESE